MKRLRKEMQEVIQEWRTHFWTPCGKEVEVFESPIRKSEFVIQFKVLLDVVVDGKSIGPISVCKRFYTFAQNNPDANPQGDVHLLKSFLVNLDGQFQNELSNFFSS